MSFAEPLTFMLIDLDYKTTKNAKSPTLRLFGKTSEAPITIYIKDFLPYFYVTYSDDLLDFIDSRPQIKYWMQKTETIILKRYFGGEKIKVLKIFGSHPEKTPEIREIFLQNNYEIHEADIPFVKRFLIDVKIGCLNLITVKPKSLQKINNRIIVTTSYKDIKSSKKRDVKPDQFYDLKVLAFDLEIDHQEETMQQILLTKTKRITSIACVWGKRFDSYKKDVFTLKELTDKSEHALIEKFLAKISDIKPDVVVTFNGDNFDFPYLLGRMKKLGIKSNQLSYYTNDSVYYSKRSRSYRIRGLIVIDLAPRTWGIHPLSGKKGLDDIAKTILNKRKKPLKRPTGEIWRSGCLRGNKEDQELLRKYCLTDSLLTYELFWSLGVHSWLEVLRTTGYPAIEASGTTARINGEFELMRFCKENKVIIPMIPSDDEVQKRKEERRKNPHKGGTVLTPKGTLHIGVIISDFKSMYPSVCVAHNIGGETLKSTSSIEQIDPFEMFSSEPQSCLSLMEGTLIKRREERKKELEKIHKRIAEEKNSQIKEKLVKREEILDKEQYSLKIVANSMYGAHNYIRSRFYSLLLANAITDIARTYILRIDELLKKVSKKIIATEMIYGDTDSAFIKILKPQYFVDIYNESRQQQKEKKLAKLIQIVNRVISSLNAEFPAAMELTLEDIAYKLIFKPGRKKAYSYLSLLSDKIDIVGFEAIRSDWSFLARESQQKVLEIILRESVKIEEKEEDEYHIIDKGLEKAREYLIRLAKHIFNSPAKELIPKAITLSPIKKQPEKYKAKTAAVKAFLDYARKENLDPHQAWKDYDKFQWVITPGKGLMSERARHPKYAKDIDREHYLTEILRASESFGINLTYQEVKTQITTMPIEKLFKEIAKAQPEKYEEDKWEKLQNEEFKRKQQKISSYLNTKEKENNEE